MIDVDGELAERARKLIKTKGHFIPEEPADPRIQGEFIFDIFRLWVYADNKLEIVAISGDYLYIIFSQHWEGEPGVIINEHGAERCLRLMREMMVLDDLAEV